MSDAGEASAEELAAKLRPRWDALCRELRVEPDAQERWWADLVKRHSEPQRVYHTLAHLDDLFLHLDVADTLVADKIAVGLAIFFHDAIYDPRAGTPQNENDSAMLFDRFGQEALPAGEPLGLAKGELIARVRRWILLTAEHEIPDGDEEENDARFFLDFDMAILGSTAAIYQRYSQQVRQEYKHIPDAIFYLARSAFLRATAGDQGKHIYSSSVFRNSHEKRARENMAREADELSKRFEACSLPMRLAARLALSKALRAWGRRVGATGALSAALAGAFFRPSVAVAAGSCLGAMLGAFGLKLAFGARYVRHPYPEPDTSAAGGAPVVLAGSYNPPHFGHLEMLRYLSKAHPKVVAVIGVNPKKKYDVSPYQRQELLRAMLRELDLADRVEVVLYGGIIFDFARSIGASAMYRGIRTWREDGRAEKFLEFQNLGYQIVRGHWPIPTAYLQGAPSLSTASSTLLRRRLAAGESIGDLVPEACADAIRQAYAPKGATSSP